MAYYPKNKIQQNLQTNGDEYKTIINYNNGIDTFYIGAYYKLYNGKTYTGRFPGDGKNEEIIPVSDSDTLPIPESSLATTNVPPLFPTPKDYELGVFTRYFKKKRNEYLFEELTKDQYDNVDNILYIRFQIQWQLTGDKTATFNTNRNMILLAEQKNNVYGFNEYLQMDYLKYYK